VQKYCLGLAWLHSVFLELAIPIVQISLLKETHVRLDILMLNAKSLAAFASVLRHGSFEDAAHELSVTPSAISQRIKGLEDQLGAILIQRGPPATATQIGKRLHRHCEEVGLLEAVLIRELDLPSATATRPHIKIATSADSLATWLLPALSQVNNMMFDLSVDDQDHSVDWLRRGEVQAVVTSHAKPIQGCDCLPLGVLRYIASASPDYMVRWLPEGATAQNIAAAPALLYNRKDRLQKNWIQRNFGQSIPIQSHTVPSSTAFVDGALLGLGWGMNPEYLIQKHLRDGRLVPILDETPYDVMLYWQFNRRISQALAPLTRAVKSAAAKVLYPA
jgi:LysR family transcriptional regulator (chromosome initiation inhibitor)